MRRRLVTTFALWATLVLIPGGVSARANWDDPQPTPNNVVDIFNQRDWSWMPESSTAVTESPGGTVDNTNYAHAKATCHYCRTVAVAVQVLVVEGATDDFRPTNAAFAENVSCSYCSTFAYANQVVLSPLHAVTIDKDARKQAEKIRDQIASTARSPISFSEMSAKLDALTQELSQVISDAIARSGAPATSDQHRQVDEKDEAP